MTGRPTFGFGSSGEAISLPTYHYRAISPKSRSLPAEHSPSPVDSVLGGFL